MQKIFDMLSTSTLAASLILSPFMAITDELDTIPFLGWIAAVALATAWTFYANEKRWGCDYE